VRGCPLVCHWLYVSIRSRYHGTCHKPAPSCTPTPFGMGITAALRLPRFEFTAMLPCPFG